MNKLVSGYMVFFAMVISFGLIGLGVSGVNITRIANAFFALVALVLVGGITAGFIASFLRR